MSAENDPFERRSILSRHSLLNSLLQVDFNNPSSVERLDRDVAPIRQELTDLIGQDQIETAVSFLHMHAVVGKVLNENSPLGLRRAFIKAILMIGYDLDSVADEDRDFFKQEIEDKLRDLRIIINSGSDNRFGLVKSAMRSGLAIRIRANSEASKKIETTIPEPFEKFLETLDL